MRRFCKDLKDHTIQIIDYKKKDMIPLRDHCHFTGKYRAAAHNTVI